MDYVVGAGIIFLILLPIDKLSWVAVAVFCIYVFISTNSVSTRRGATILFATTMPMLWSRLVFKFFANSILNCDAALVSWLLGTRRAGNIVEFADNSGQLVILPPCSSLANVSLAILCWVTVSQLTGHKRSSYDVLWCLCACASVIAVNVTRMEMMGLSERNYDIIHSNYGDLFTNVIICALMIGICLLGVRRELYVSV
jgi:hypothetical protein